MFQCIFKPFVNFNYVQSQLRSHFLKIIQSGVVVSFPAGFKRETRGKSNYRFSKMILYTIENRFRKTLVFSIYMRGNKYQTEVFPNLN